MRTPQRERRQPLHVFFGSPGDVNDERSRFRKVLDEVNRIKANELGLHLEPLGSEDTLPGKGRPQAIINEQLEKSRLIVFMFWKRWGTPTGEFSSGTEEEFEIARRLSDTSPGEFEIWLYFKSVPDERRADPGDQLKQVLAFRERMEAERSFKYYLFKNADAWESVFREHLCKWLSQVCGPRMLWRGKKRMTTLPRRDAVSVVLAAQASQDARVQEFRKHVLGGQLVPTGQVAEWIKHQAELDGPATHWLHLPLPEGHTIRGVGGGLIVEPPLTITGSEPVFGVETKFLEYGVPTDSWRHLMPVKAGGVLDRLRRLSENLAERYGWQNGQATVFVIARAVPLLSAVRVGLELRSPPAASRVSMAFDLALPPRDVARYYKSFRGRILNVSQPEPSLREIRLAEFFATEPPESTSAERMRVWNSEHRQWTYKAAEDFERECQSACNKLLYSHPSFDLSKLFGAAKRRS